MYTKELLDNDNIPFNDIQLNMKELDIVNSRLGGHHITLNGVKLLLANFNNNYPITICEIGCGGGDNLNYIYRYFKKNNLPVTLIGIDKKKECIEFARKQYPQLNATWIVSDYKLIDFKKNKPDINFSSLFCHHFSETELVQMLLWQKNNSKRGFFINDLHRHLLAYYSIKWLTALFSKSYLVKNDAPLSVARGFTKKEWQKIFSSAGIHPFFIKWKWAFRHLIVCKND